MGRSELPSRLIGFGIFAFDPEMKPQPAADPDSPVPVGSHGRSNGVQSDRSPWGGARLWRQRRFACLGCAGTSDSASPPMCSRVYSIQAMQRSAPNRIRQIDPQSLHKRMAGRLEALDLNAGAAPHPVYET